MIELFVLLVSERWGQGGGRDNWPCGEPVEKGGPGGAAPGGGPWGEAPGGDSKGAGPFRARVGRGPHIASGAAATLHGMVLHCTDLQGGRRWR